MFISTNAFNITLIVDRKAYDCFDFNKYIESQINRLHVCGHTGDESDLSVVYVGSTVVHIFIHRSP
jgi:hypothetical protein